MHAGGVCPVFATGGPPLTTEHGGGNPPVLPFCITRVKVRKCGRGDSTFLGAARPGRPRAAAPLPSAPGEGEQKVGVRWLGARLRALTRQEDAAAKRLNLSSGQSKHGGDASSAVLQVVQTCLPSPAADGNVARSASPQQPTPDIPRTHPTPASFPAVFRWRGGSRAI